MANLKAISLMALWTLGGLAALYFAGATTHFRDPLWILPISLSVLLIHVINMVIYFKVARDAPYKWQKKPST